MNPRIEQKIPFNIVDYPSILKWIKDNKGKILFPKRIITSRYFDNFKLEMFHETQEGIIPRKKIRIRNYNKEPKFNLKNNKLEIKISSAEGRFKIVKKKDIGDLFGYKFEDNNYGTCYPISCVSYKRVYYKIKNIRLTIDTSIKYRKVKLGKISHFFQVEPFNVIELKFTDMADTGLVSSFPFHYVRFSKYSRSIEFNDKKYSFL